MSYTSKFYIDLKSKLWGNILSCNVSQSDWSAGQVLPADQSIISIKSAKVNFNTRYEAINRYVTLYKEQRSIQNLITSYIGHVNISTKRQIMLEFPILESAFEWIKNGLYGDGLEFTIGRCTSDGKPASTTGNTGNAIYFELTVEWDYTFVRSTFTATDSNIGESTKIVFSNIANTQNLTHTMTYAFQGYEGSAATIEYSRGQITNGYTDAYLFSQQCLQFIQSGRTATVNITLRTYNGADMIGQYTQAITVTVTNEFAPQIKGVTVNKTYSSPQIQAVIEPWNEFIQGFTGANIQVSVDLSPFTTVTSYVMNIADSTYTSDNGTFVTPMLNQAGDLEYTIVAIDNRGIASDYVGGTIQVRQYAKPEINVTMRPQRCNSVGITDSEGLFGRGAFDGSVSPCGGKNSMILSIGFSTTPEGNIIILANDIRSGETVIFGGSLNPSVTYYIHYIAKDALTSTTAVFELSTSQYAIHIKNGGNGVAFGKTSEKDDAVQINANWDVYHGADKVYLPQFKIACGSINCSGVSQGVVNYGAFGFKNTPKVIATCTTTSSEKPSTNCTIIVYDKSLTGCKIIFNDTSNVVRNVDWIAIGI